MVTCAGTTSLDFLQLSGTPSYSLFPGCTVLCRAGTRSGLLSQYNAGAAYFPLAVVSLRFYTLVFCYS